MTFTTIYHYIGWGPFSMEADGKVIEKIKNVKQNFLNHKAENWRHRYCSTELIFVTTEILRNYS